MAVGLALAAVGGRGSVVGTPDVMATGVEGGRGWRVVMGVAETGETSGSGEFTSSVTLFNRNTVSCRTYSVWSPS